MPSHLLLFRRPAPLLLFVVLLLPPAAHARARTYRFAPPQPAGIVPYARPTVYWHILPEDGMRVSRVFLAINGKRVDAGYSTARQAIVHEVADPLPPGAYTVECRLVLGGDWPIERTWQFSVAEGAVQALPAPDAAQRAAGDQVNAYRRHAGLAPLTLEARLCASASGHAGYVRERPDAGHLQRDGDPGFTGAQPGDRNAAFGYYGDSFEGVDYGARTMTEAVRGLFEAPYHRRPFLQPGTTDLGVGRSGRATALEFGRTTVEATVVYPADGQRNVPLAWDGIETPSPLWLHAGARAPVGFVITLFQYGPDDATVRVSEATLQADGGESVPFYLNTSDRDPSVHGGVFLIPKAPLKPHTTYRVSVTATTGGGRDISRTWRFTTGP